MQIQLNIFAIPQSHAHNTLPTAGLLRPHPLHALCIPPSHAEMFIKPLTFKATLFEPVDNKIKIIFMSKKISIYK